jgi:hypothetical protein
MDYIRETKQYSPRTKANMMNKLKIEHMLWRVDLAMEK